VTPLLSTFLFLKLKHFPQILLTKLDQYIAKPSQYKISVKKIDNHHRISHKYKKIISHVNTHKDNLQLESNYFLISFTNSCGLHIITVPSCPCPLRCPTLSYRTRYKAYYWIQEPPRVLQRLVAQFHHHSEAMWSSQCGTRQ